jgi:hypothetical protein
MYYVQSLIDCNRLPTFFKNFIRFPSFKNSSHHLNRSKSIHNFQILKNFLNVVYHNMVLYYNRKKKF